MKRSLIQPNLINRSMATPIGSGVYVSTGGLASRYSNDIGWLRPIDWPALTPIPEGTQKVQGLYAVFDTTSERVAFTCAGDYTVDWGDGSATEVFAAGTKAEHAYTYSTLATSVTSRGYKTAIITITPQSGQNLTSVNLATAYTEATAGTRSTCWLDLELRVPNCTSLTIGDAACRHPLLEQGLIREHSAINFNSLFRNCFALHSVPLFNTAAVTDMSSMFNSCFSLRSVPLFNTAAVTNMSYMFNNCCSLRSVPVFDTALVGNMSYMFNACYSLPEAPAFNTAAVTTMLYMFNACYSLQFVPLLNTALVTNMSFMFATCYSLQFVPLFNTAAVTNMASMFATCSSLQIVPLFNTAAVTNMASMFATCSALQLLPALVMAAVTTATLFAANCNALGRFLGTGLRYSFSFLNSELSATALNEIFTNLGTAAAGGQTITITGNPGAATCNSSIAIAKGWTVTG